MLYAAYELAHQALVPLRAFGRAASEVIESPANPYRDSVGARAAQASYSVFEQATRRYRKPTWNLPETEVNGNRVPVSVERVVERPFGSLIRFRRSEVALRAAGRTAPDPRVLIVAPMSGHYATLLRGTVQAMLPDHEVFITDWADARKVPVLQGGFDFNDYVDYLISFLQAIGPGAHTVAVCQPGPALVAAAAVMARKSDPCGPRSMTIMGSPIDARQSPTVTNLLAEQRSFEWFERNMIQTVPLPHAGAGRRVYPGFLQLASFMSMNAERHAEAQWDYFENLIHGDEDAAEKHVRFYDEYLSVCDMTAEFYLQTIRDVFQEYLLPRGLLTHRGEVVDPGLITDCGLMTVEGELDDISGIGQTVAAHDLCSGLKAADKIDYVQKGAGHYGVFNGSKWRTEIQPKIAAFIRERFDVDEERGFLSGMSLAAE
ncbi:polyhydroxyalkanoate depolymerase [Parvularcula dongshanensis]|uniref:Poly(3-hydroxybutyrate) depolymerase n=1 Tax=Parvularcula dongshanensis TaxID=1173995 RepID=A0A840I1V8_9PROT|nr:polyhydroxyalkanoate depolymerase [Parvularcula dongshanensis]MBB4658050.1 poly(3-hydroxybutyrate) depolymerase [Parvularcula dongshanensis]